MYFIGGALLFTGVLLFRERPRAPRRQDGKRPPGSPTRFVVGIGQAIALCPGVSRPA